MKLPAISEPSRYRGLYVFDFGEWTAVGYTAEEVATLLESEEYSHGQVYRIVRSTPEGGMELRGVPRERFNLESGMFFNRQRSELARDDYDTLVQLARDQGAPCRAYVQLADRGDHEGVARYVTALVYPAEYDDEMARWLRAAQYIGGDTVEGGPSHVADYYADEHVVLEREQLWSQPARPSRDADEVLANVRQAVQR